MASERRAAWGVLAAALAVGAMRWLGRARVPDDYDSIGFVRGLARFDLAELRPHFPGYPVYIALGKIGVAAGMAPLAAATLISAIAAAATAAAVWRLACTMLGEARAGAIAMALYAAAWLPWQLGGAALSDATATAFVALAFAALTYDRRDAAALAGVAMALALGTRASYWPLAASFAVVAARRPHARAALAGAVVGALAWVVPFVAIVHPAALVGLARTHLRGHFTTWGGTIATEPRLGLRLFAFARAIAHDGLVANPWLLVVAAALVLLCARPVPRSRTAWLVVALPYALWVLFAQNVVEQPRHVLPLVVFACVMLGVALAGRPLAGIAVVGLALAASTPLAWTRARTPPAAAQAATWVAATYPAKNAVAVFGGKSLRFFDELAPSVVTRTRTWASEVDVELERLDVLPPVLLLTSEVDVDATRTRRVGDGPRFCRDERIDRAEACLSLRRYRLR
jgi:4-amino-4-deoxy-L-arabinose transferase-like glycosyltransferase